MGSCDSLGELLAHAPAALAAVRSAESQQYAEVECVSPHVDLGCGDGLFGKVALQSPGIGVDRSLRALRYARQRRAYDALVCADLCALPFGDGTVATVTANSVLEHITDIDEALRETSRVLAKDGRAVIAVPTQRAEESFAGHAILCRLGMPRIADRYVKLYDLLFGQRHMISRGEWLSLVAKNGLCVLRARPFCSRGVFRLHELTLVPSLLPWLCHRLWGRYCLFPRVRKHTLAPMWAKWLRARGLDGADGDCSLFLIATPSIAK